MLVYKQSFLHTSVNRGEGVLRLVIDPLVEDFGQVAARSSGECRNTG